MVTEMQTTIKVYQTADMLGIESLKLVTTRKVIDMLATKSNAKFLELVLGTLFPSAAGRGLLQNAVVDACAYNYHEVRNLPLAVALLQEHETRVWRLARHNYALQVQTIQEYIQDTVVEVCNQLQCLNSDCTSVGMAICSPELHWSPNDIASGYACCVECGFEFPFSVGPR